MKIPLKNDECIEAINTVINKEKLEALNACTLLLGNVS